MTNSRATASAISICQAILGHRSIDDLVPRDQLPGLLGRHGVASLVAAKIAEGSFSTHGLDVDEIQSLAARARRHSAILNMESERIGRAVAERLDRPPILVKGSSVARHYKNPDRRTFIDIDLLVDDEVLEETGDVLAELGYVRPTERSRRDAKFFGEVKFQRLIGDVSILVELHNWFVPTPEGRRFNYQAAAELSDSGPNVGLLELRLEAHLVILAMHYIHHTIPRRRGVSIWDFIELADGDVVEKARDLSDRFGLRPVLEEVLADAECALGERRWQASPPQHRYLPGEGPRSHLALVKNLGWRLGTGYVTSRLKRSASEP